MKKLIIYPNCSKGGVATVIRGRARSEPSTEFHTLFFHDKGGLNAFADLKNVVVRIVRIDRMEPYLKSLVRNQKYSKIHVLSSPKAANILTEISEIPVEYEFHSSDLAIIAKEIKELKCDRIARFVTPTRYMAGKVRDLLPARVSERLSVKSNLVDDQVFAEEGCATYFQYSRFLEDRVGIPLLWVGRFDKGKGYKYFIRLLSQLPDEYFGIVVVSLESEPGRADEFLSECAVMGVFDRVRILLNVPQPEMASLYRSVRDRKGWLVSTSLMESFGYIVAEATACGLRSAIFRLPAIEEHASSELTRSVPLGEVQYLREVITNFQS